MLQANPASSDHRREDRDKVHHRTRALHADGRTLQLLIVNISPHGFMARCDAPLGEDDGLKVQLPGVGQASARIRWALGGRIGCQFDTAIPLAHYQDLVALLLR